MSLSIIKKLPAAEEIIQAIPLSAAGYQQVERDRQEVKNILDGKDNRYLVIVGPCSAWPDKAVLSYAHKLLELNEQVKHVLKLIMRVYIQKPRTTKGWTGPVNQPNPLLPPDITKGIKYTREMMVKIVEMGLPIADEALFTHNANVFLELLSWVAIGARSSEDQEHRIFASAIDCPVGLKNPTHGSLEVGVNSIVAAQHSHVAVLDGYEVKTSGNDYAHLVLRGGNQEPNYSLANLVTARQLMEFQKIQNPAIVIDASHDNCIFQGKKNYNLQPNVIFEVLDFIRLQPELKKLIKGFMIESFLKGGNQKVDGNDPQNIDLSGLSITDPCLSWEQTVTAILKFAEIVEKNRV